MSEPEGNSTPLHAAGGTPVFKLTRLAEKLRLQNLWLKDESRNPTASFKDRASAIVVARAREINAEVVVTASTGNAGAATRYGLIPFLTGDLIKIGLAVLLILAFAPAVRRRL